MKLYHGSTHKFDKFDFSKLGENATDQGQGFYFTDNIDLATCYTKDGGFIYTVEFNGKKALSSKEKNITREELGQVILAIEEDTQFLSNYGDVSWDGLEAVLEEALDCEYEGSDNNVDLINGLINGSGDIETVLNATYEILGYDHIVEEGLFQHIGENKVYVALVQDCFQIVNVEQK